MINKKDELIKNGRKMLKPNWRDYDFEQNDACKGIKPLPLQKVFSPETKFIELIKFGETCCGNEPLPKVIANRKSRRKYTDDSLTLEELSYLLWTTQGLKWHDEECGSTVKVVPSAGMIHCIETYLFINRVEGVPKGLYRYLPKEQRIIEGNMADDCAEKLVSALKGNYWSAAVVFLWTAVPYKMEWGYMEVSHKMIAIEAGHVCQNLYLSAESINCGCCAVAAYLQDEIDSLLGIDGDDEFVIYTATVGKLDDSCKICKQNVCHATDKISCGT